MERRVTSHTEEEEMNQRRHLLELARKGDQKAVGTLMELYQVRVYSGENLRRVRPSRPSPSPSKSRSSKLSPQKPQVATKFHSTTPSSERKVEGPRSSRKKTSAVKKSAKRAKTKVPSGPKVTKKPAHKTRPTRARSPVKAKPVRVSQSKSLQKKKVSLTSRRSSKVKVAGKPKAIKKKTALTKVRIPSKSKASHRKVSLSKARKARPGSKTKVAGKRRGR